MMNQKNKTKTVDEGVKDLAKDLAGSAKNWVASKGVFGKKAYLQALKNTATTQRKAQFVSNLTQYLNTLTKRLKEANKTTQTNEGVIQKYTSLFESALNKMIYEDGEIPSSFDAANKRYPATPEEQKENEVSKNIKSKVTQFVKGQFPGYDWTNFEKDLETEVDDFVQKFIAGGYKVPPIEAEQLFDIGMAAGATQKRDSSGYIIGRSGGFGTGNNVSSELAMQTAPKVSDYLMKIGPEIEKNPIEGSKKVLDQIAKLLIMSNEYGASKIYNQAFSDAKKDLDKSTGKKTA